MNKDINREKSTPNQSDIEILQTVFDLPLLHYIDVFSEEQLKTMVIRWPLLAEFMQTELIKKGS